MGKLSAPDANRELLERLRECAQPLDAGALDGLLCRVGDARYVLLGEASHGSHEFYDIRAELTKRLIRDKGFSIVAVEADWPDAYRVNRYIRGAESAGSAEEALSGFERFPTWMWRNKVVLELVTWLREHNRASPQPVGFYGLDLYSLHASMNAVLEYLERTDPAAVQSARARYSCFDRFGGDPQRYGHATSLGYVPSCEDAVIEQLVALHARRAEALQADGLSAREELFFAEQNARVVTNAERYYRTMYRGGVASWNLRDTHMADTVDALCKHLGQSAESAKVIIWAHNSHVGDARATELAEQGELNLGQLMRERHPERTFIVGFSTFEGHVTAASDWDGPAERKRVRPALRDSHEALLHALELARFLLPLKLPELASALDRARLQRAIGVVYEPRTERASHYYHTRLASQFDALIHVDRTTALEPLAGHDRDEPEDELPETYPSGL
jgi:erythromycin esterase-like protein